MAATGLANLAEGESLAHLADKADPVAQAGPGHEASGVTDGPASGWIVIDAFFYLVR